MEKRLFNKYSFFRKIQFAFLIMESILSDMNIINHIKESIQRGWPQDLTNQYNAWHYEVLQENWTCFADIQDHYVEAECQTPDKVAFHIMRRKAVIYVHVEYAIGWVYVRFVGTNEDFTDFLKKQKEVA